MSLFEDFADFLDREQAQEEQVAEAEKKRLLLARKAYDGLLRQTFSIIREYYQTVLAPRRDLFLVLKKDIALTEGKDEYFLHRVNIIAQDSVPIGINLRYVSNPYLMPEKITPHDWHPNVALQASVFLTGNDDTKLVFRCRVWGEITTKVPVGNRLVPE